MGCMQYITRTYVYIYIYIYIKTTCCVHRGSVCMCEAPIRCLGMSFCAEVLIFASTAILAMPSLTRQPCRPCRTFPTISRALACMSVATSRPAPYAYNPNHAERRNGQYLLCDLQGGRYDGSGLKMPSVCLELDDEK